MEEKETRLVLKDNQQASVLLGTGDENFRYLKSLCPAEIFARGTEITIRGRGEDVVFTSHLIENLIDIVESEGHLAISDINYTNNLAQRGENARHQDIVSGNILNTARGKGVKAKTLRQKRYIQAILKDDVDLFGQVCSESIGTRQISGTGGQLDFVDGAYKSKGGQGFLCIPSTYENGAGEICSNIKATLTPGAIVTDPRTSTQMLVTEFGIAELKGKSTWERAETLISIAHPRFREELIKEAQKMKIWRKSNRIY